MNAFCKLVSLHKSYCHGVDATCRFPNGESGADVYDRMTIFEDHLVRDINAGAFGPVVRRSLMPCNTLFGHVLMSQARSGLSPFILLAIWSLHSDTALMLCRSVLKAHLSGASHAWPGCKDIPHAVVPLDSGAIHGGLQPSKRRGEGPCTCSCTCDPACVTWYDSPASYHLMGSSKKDLSESTGDCHSLQIRM